MGKFKEGQLVRRSEKIDGAGPADKVFRIGAYKYFDLYELCSLEDGLSQSHIAEEYIVALGPIEEIVIETELRNQQN